ncbi:hypothetical protein LTR54_010671 [Friedmanniomyces endolithicus]|uniref:IBR domain-containing protein n=1 Tax=Friedmanniomyces endolithicus TaxID=329885 RepID=A0AAN6J5Z8_9PEZI|nr:hypothetical protein LTR82_010584 [Friedmanniomyces endolithicus]KAK0994574.1 hypothetical protein LTR54_010671 [Friedmanniomyces endolithicus]
MAESENANVRTYTCVTCRDENTGATSYPAGGHRVCADCAADLIVPIFIDSLRYEAHYPPKLDESTLLNPADYADLLPLDYAHELRCKRNEYEMRSGERLYCHNTVPSKQEHSPSMTYPFHALIGTKMALSSTDILQAKNRGIKLTTCDEFLGSRSSRESQPPSREREFEGATRGLDYQLCPNEACGCPVYLGEACNHMTCQHHSCHTQFCFLCGEAVAYNAHHWAVGMPCPRYGRPVTATAIHDGEVIHGEVVGPAEGFADAVADAENAPDEGMDDEEPDPWPHFPDDGAVPAPAEVHDMLHALREMHWLGYVDGVREHGQTITVHWVSKKVHDVICALFRLSDQLRHADITRENIVGFVAIADATMRVLEMSLQHGMHHDIGAAGIELYAVLQDGVHLVRDLHARFFAAAELALETIDGLAAADDETADGIQAESDGQTALRQEWQLSDWDLQHIPAQVLAVLDALRDTFMQAHVYAEGDAASVGIHHVAKAVHTATRTLYSLTVHRAFHIDVQEDEVRQARTLADGAMELFNSAIALEAEHGDIEAGEQDELVSAAIDMLKQDYLELLTAVLIFLGDIDVDGEVAL